MAERMQSRWWQPRAVKSCGRLECSSTGHGETIREFKDWSVVPNYNLYKETRLCLKCPCLFCWWTYTALRQARWLENLGTTVRDSVKCCRCFLFFLAEKDSCFAVGSFQCFRGGFCHESVFGPNHLLAMVHSRDLRFVSSIKSFA